MRPVLLSGREQSDTPLYHDALSEYHPESSFKSHSTSGKGWLPPIPNYGRLCANQGEGYQPLLGAGTTPGLKRSSCDQSSRPRHSRPNPLYPAMGRLTYKHTTTDSFEEKFSNLDISAEPGVSVLCRMLGSGWCVEYLSRKKMNIRVRQAYTI